MDPYEQVDWNGKGLRMFLLGVLILIAFGLFLDFTGFQGLLALLR